MSLRKKRLFEISESRRYVYNRFVRPAVFWNWLLRHGGSRASMLLDVSIQWCWCISADSDRVRGVQSKMVREKPRECHNHKPQPFPDTKRKRKPTNPNKHKSNKRTKSTKISSLFPQRGNRNAKRTGKHKNKMTHGKTYNKSPRRKKHKSTRSKTNTGTTALERSV